MFDRIRALIQGTVPDPESEIRIAVAALLCESARMDDHFDEVERARIETLLVSRFGLTPEEAARLEEVGEEAERKSTHLYRFTHLLVQEFSLEQRIDVIEMMWEVAYADGALDPEEDALIRKIAGLLYVPDRERGIARKRALERLGLTAS
jgi:uncharacterized tellurite resistance protein B-like protein